MRKKLFGTTNFDQRVQLVINELENLPAGLKILDVGAGQCYYKKYCSHLEYVSQDFCEYTGEGDGKGLHTNQWDTSSIDIISDITNIPVEDGSFDVILCSDVIEHVPDPFVAFKEMDRILKKGGYMILAAPFCSATHFAPYHFCSGFNRYFYENIFSSNYVIEKIVSYGNWYEYIAQELFRFNSISKKYAKRKITLFDKLLIMLMVLRLKSFSKKSKDSEEFLCFGYLCKAQKNGK